MCDNEDISLLVPDHETVGPVLCSRELDTDVLEVSTSVPQQSLGLSCWRQLSDSIGVDDDKLGVFVYILVLSQVLVVSLVPEL